VHKYSQVPQFSPSVLSVSQSSPSVLSVSQSSPLVLSSPQTLSKFYTPFQNCPGLVIEMIERTDKIFHISGPLSYSITYTWINGTKDKIELVDCNQLWKYRQDNGIKINTKKMYELKDNLNIKFKSIQENGLSEPISLYYYPASGGCKINNGNEILHWAKYNQIKFLPTKIELNENNEKNLKKAPKKISSFENLSPSKIGFKIHKKYPNHPYYSNELSLQLKKEYFSVKM
jgi:hypothetical protein